jgi:hypothetical protein
MYFTSRHPGNFVRSLTNAGIELMQPLPTRNNFQTTQYEYQTCRVVFLLCNNRHNILVSNYMAQSHPLRNMSSASTPYESILERVLQRPMNLIAYVFDC